MKAAYPLTRRELLHSAVVVAGGAALASTGLAACAPPTEKPKLPTRPFGKTKREVCMLCLGTGQVARVKSFDEGVEVIGHALDAGITCIDTAVSYRSEGHIGKAIAGRRKGLFIATKTAQRSYDGAMRELEKSLELLGTDHLELWHVHGGGRVAQLRKPDGVMKAVRKAKEQGVIDFIGFTGHSSPEAMLEVLAADDLKFDAMLFTISAALARGDNRGWEERVLPAGQKQGLGLIAMKVFGAGRAVGQGAERGSPAELLHYVWDRGVPVANVGMNSKEEVDAAVAALKAYKPKQGAPDGGAALPACDDRDVALRGRFRELVLPFEQPNYQDGWPAEVA